MERCFSHYAWTWDVSSFYVQSIVNHRVQRCVCVCVIILVWTYTGVFPETTMHGDISSSRLPLFGGLTAKLVRFVVLNQMTW